MNIKSLLFFTGLCFIFACSSKENASTSNTTNKEATAKVDQKTNTEDLETSIKNIRETFQDTENNLKSFTKKIAEIEEGDEGNVALTGYYDMEGEPRKIIREAYMGHGAVTTSYYLKDGSMYFLFEQRTAEASVMGPFTFMEKRIYFKDGEVIRLLEKEKTVEGEEDPQMSKVPNQDVTASLKNKSGQVYFDEIKNLLQVLATAGKAAKKGNTEELSFENTRWKSTDDPKSVIAIKNGKWNNIYDGKNLSSGDYKLEKKADGSQLTVNENGEIYQYYIIKHTATELQLSMIGGRGNTLSYDRD